MAVEEDTSIYQAWVTKANTEGEDELELGSLKGRCRCENRSQQVGGEQVVLSLLHLPGDRGCSGAAGLGEGEELPF